MQLLISDCFKQTNCNADKMSAGTSAATTATSERKQLRNPTVEGKLAMRLRYPARCLRFAVAGLLNNMARLLASLINGNRTETKKRI